MGLIHQNIIPFAKNEDYETQTFPDVVGFFPPSIPEHLFIYRRITIRISFRHNFYFFKAGSCKLQCKKKSRSLDFEDIIANPGLNCHRSLHFWQGYVHPYLQAHFLFPAKLTWKFCKYQFRTEGDKKRRPSLNCTSKYSIWSVQDFALLFLPYYIKSNHTV